MSNNNQQYDNTNKGSLFINKAKFDKSTGKDTSGWPDMQGKINVYGVEFYLSAWTNKIKKGDNAGDKFQALTIKPVDENEAQRLASFLKGGSAPAKAKKHPKHSTSEEVADELNEFDDDDLPF